MKENLIVNVYFAGKQYFLKRTYVLCECLYTFCYLSVSLLYIVVFHFIVISYIDEQK